jgi:peptidoglycan hydrolase CwlO-like protein
MGLFSFHIDKVVVQYDDHKLNSIIKKLNVIMGKVEDLQQVVSDLQTSLDAKQEAIAAAIAAFEQTIADLTAQLATGATADQLQAIIDSVTAAKTDLEGTPTA